MEDRRLAGLERKTEIAPEVRQLSEDRREDAVVVQPGLADRHHPRVRGEGDDLGPAIVVDQRRVVGMDADRGVEPWKTFDQVERPAAGVRVPSRNEDPFDAGQACATDDEVEVAFEAVGLEMAVAVDEAHRRIVAAARGISAAPSGCR